jgi:hypothetical protein
MAPLTPIATQTGGETNLTARQIAQRRRRERERLERQQSELQQDRGQEGVQASPSFRCTDIF